MKFTIGEAAAQAGITASTVRFYDSKGLLPFMERNNGGIRVFDELDVNWLQFLGFLKTAGMSIDDMVTYVGLYLGGDETVQERRDMIYAQKQKVDEQMKKLQDAHDMVKFKCWLYDSALETGSLATVRNMPREEMPDDIREISERFGVFQPYYLMERYRKSIQEAEDTIGRSGTEG